MRVLNPKNSELIREVEEDATARVQAKYQRARAAQPGFAATPLSQRLETIRRFSAIVEARQAELARILTDETGKPIRQAQRELRGLKSRIEFFLEQTPARLAEAVVHEEPGLTECIRSEPLGVIANISAWNYPYFVGSNVFIPALLTGNTVLYKPSELATLSGLAMTEALWEAGVPRDAFVPVVGAGTVGRALLDQPIDGVFFTGSVATGRKIAEQVAPRFLRMQLELGGKDPAYVTEDVDVTATAEAVADGAFYNAGQSCCAVERIYVQRAIWDEFLGAFVTAVRGMKLGDPLERETYIGPLARGRAQVEFLLGQIRDAESKGARVLLGGHAVEGVGSFLEPTVLVDVDHSMQVMREESFGPIVGLMPVASDAQAVELMRDTDYGLTAAVYVRDRERGARLLERLPVGSAYLNCCDRVSPRLPWSGRGQSGTGCTLSVHGIDAFLARKAWHLRA